jgi:hypothetical protein
VISRKEWNNVSISIGRTLLGLPSKLDIQTQPGWKPYKSLDLGIVCAYILLPYHLPLHRYAQIIHQGARDEGRKPPSIPNTRLKTPFPLVDEQSDHKSGERRMDTRWRYYHFGVRWTWSVVATRPSIPLIFPIENEAEVSFFNRGDYDAFKLSPEVSFHTVGGRYWYCPRKIKWEWKLVLRKRGAACGTIWL